MFPQVLVYGPILPLQQRSLTPLANRHSGSSNAFSQRVFTQIAQWLLVQLLFAQFFSEIKQFVGKISVLKPMLDGRSGCL
ncbi:MAG: hypothetical protein B0A82_09335 [Alkalinema sp. CACIAM 70d]|nr:MAG: hypothetical protein B0A82_09335 [Alkalinema sp. CACIAM 70d]